MSGGGPGGPNTAENLAGGRNTKCLGGGPPLGNGGQNKIFLEDVLEGLEDGIPNFWMEDRIRTYVCL